MFLENDQTYEIDQYSGGQLHWVSSLECACGRTDPRAGRDNRCRSVRRDPPRIRFRGPARHADLDQRWLNHLIIPAL